MARRIPLLLLVLVVASIPMASCNSCGGPNVAVTTYDHPGDINNHQVRCGCQLRWKDFVCNNAGPDAGLGIPANICNPNPRSFNIDMCVPERLNTSLGATLTEDEFKAGIQAFCGAEVKTLVKAFVNMVGGERSCLPIDTYDVACAPVEIDSTGSATASNPRCDKHCLDVPCVTSADAGTVNCDLRGMNDSNGNIHPEVCQCTRGSGCGVTSTGICQPLDSVTDPPEIADGILTGAASQPTTISIDPEQSKLTLTVAVEKCVGKACVSLSDTQTTSAHGFITLYGTPCPGSECNVRLAMQAHPDDVTFKFGCVASVCLGDAPLSHMSVVGGTEGIPLHVNADGSVLAQPYSIKFVASGIRDGKGYRVETFNLAPLLLRIDWAARTLTAPDGIPVDFAGATGSLSLAGTVVNYPPVARVGPDQVLECNVPGGASAVLDATGSYDPDDDQIGLAWWRDHALDPATSVGSGLVVSTVAPMGTTRYGFAITDSHLALSYAETSVTVKDTAGPEIAVSVNTACLKSPADDLFLFRLGEQIVVQAHDACDANPRVWIDSVTRVPASHHEGSEGERHDDGEHQAPDVIAGTASFCIREEGSYSVVVAVQDASGNISRKTVVVRVPEDQEEHQKCGTESGSDDVNDGGDVSPCRENVPAPSPAANPVPEPVPPAAAPPPSASGCSAAGTADTVAVSSLGALVLAALRFGRRRIRG